MSGTSSRAAEAEPGLLVPPSRESAVQSDVGKRRFPIGLVIDLGLGVFAVAAVFTMWANPHWGTVPYHLLFLSVMLVYGFRGWSLPVTAVVVVTIVVVTGGLMIGDYRDDIIDGAELSEIVLMPLLLVAMVWHARRRLVATRSLEKMAALQLDMLERERNFFRDTSHAIRTPVTIARGHLELAMGAVSDQTVSEDVDVAIRQLDRMSVLSNRLLALAQLDAGERLPAQQVDLASFVEEVGAGWAANAARRWVVECPTGASLNADPVWLALAVDALVENAVHFTEDGGRIEIRGVVGSRTCSIVVSDDGPGILPSDLEQVFERFWHRRPPNGPMGSGLGLAMAKATARSWGGHVHAANNPAGGASFALVLPRCAVTG